MTGVTTRTYRSELRDAQAAQTRLRVLAAAADEFAAHGYAGTTIAAIAAAARVSAETVKAQGAKHELLAASYEVAFAGRESRDQIMDGDAMRALVAATPGGGLPELLASHAADMNARAGRLWLAFTGAAQSDPAVGAALADLLARRRRDFALVVEALDAAGLVSSPAPREELAAELSFLGSPEGYQQLVVESGWAPERYADWLARSIRRVAAGE